MVQPMFLHRAGKEGSLQQQLERSARKASESKSLHLVSAPQWVWSVHECTECGPADLGATDQTT